jgi:hypothetical protein
MQSVKEMILCRNVQCLQVTTRFDHLWHVFDERDQLVSREMSQIVYTLHIWTSAACRTPGAGTSRGLSFTATSPPPPNA